MSEDYYTAHGQCLNCGNIHRFELPKGDEIADQECPRCGCRAVTPFLRVAVMERPVPLGPE